MIVLKFGGTSMGSAKRMEEVSMLVKRDVPCVVVLSAMAGVTDKLVETGDNFKKGDREAGMNNLQYIRNRFEHTCLELFRQKSSRGTIMLFLEKAFDDIACRVSGEISQEKINWLAVQGEMITSRIFADYLQERGFPSVLLDAAGFMRLDEAGEPDLPAIGRLLTPMLRFGGDLIYVTQGFVCMNHRGETDNLKRGGSDYSATLIGAAVRAEMIEIWTDIDGMQNNDPREVENTFSIRRLSFDEAAELAYFGAKILHPACVWPAQQFNIPIWLRNTMDPGNPGTMIRSGGERQQITAIAAKDQITAIRIRSGRMLNTYGFLVMVFKVFEDFQTPIDMITTSEVSVSLTIDNDNHLDGIVGALEKYGIVEVDKDQSIICVVGDFLVDRYGCAARILHSLHNIPIRMISYGGSQNNISFLVSSKDKNRTLNELNAGLFRMTKLPEYAHS
ncbi:MAG: aspartate kinase [Bacteroidetes bacterium]|nr:MAG: aspartate kinase [Bacteroidota bacterium]